MLTLEQSRVVTEALRTLREACRITGCERIEVTVRRDGRVHLAGSSPGIPSGGSWHAEADLLEGSALPFPGQVLREKVASCAK